GTGQIADERGGRAPAPAARGQRVPRSVASPHRARDLRGQFEYFPVEQEKSREPEVGDQGQLLLESRACFSLQTVRTAVPGLEGAVADAGQLGDCGLVAVGEVRIPVAELVGEVELEPFGELGGAGGGVTGVGEAR